MAFFDDEDDEGNPIHDESDLSINISPEDLDDLHNVHQHFENERQNLERERAENLFDRYGEDYEDRMRRLNDEARREFDKPEFPGAPWRKPYPNTAVDIPGFGMGRGEGHSLEPWQGSKSHWLKAKPVIGEDQETINHELGVPKRSLSSESDSLAWLGFKPYTPEPVAPRVHQSEPIDDHEYSLNEVSRRYPWEGFDKYEIEHLVHNPEKARFTLENVPIDSLRHLNEHGDLIRPPDYEDIASQGEEDEDESERERLEELERGYNQGADIPPAVVVRDGPHHIIADGSHRAAVYERMGETHMPAFVTQRTIPSMRHEAAANPGLEVREYEGEPGNPDHITRSERGMIPVDWVRNMLGARGERPGEHRNRQGQDWEDFKNALTTAGDSGIHAPIFITVDYGKQPQLAEGNHRRDAYVELGHTHIPAEIRYFGHSERQGTVGERAEDRMRHMGGVWAEDPEPIGPGQELEMPESHKAWFASKGWTPRQEPLTGETFAPHFTKMMPSGVRHSLFWDGARAFQRGEPVYQLESTVADRAKSWRNVHADKDPIFETSDPAAILRKAKDNEKEWLTGQRSGPGVLDFMKPDNEEYDNRFLVQPFNDFPANTIGQGEFVEPKEKLHPHWRGGPGGRSGLQRLNSAIPDESGLKAAGIAVIALDTGRVLMQQRALNPLHCPCGLGVTWDPMNGYQHDDGSISHDGEFYGQSVSDLLDQGHPDPVPCPCCNGTGDDLEGSECAACDGSGSDPHGSLCDPPCRDPESMDSESDTGADQDFSRYNDLEGSDTSGFDKTAALEFDPNEGTWEFPGGKIDPGESPRDAAIREFKEEVGQALPPGVFVGAWVSPGGISVTAAPGKVDPQYLREFHNYLDREVSYSPEEFAGLSPQDQQDLVDSFGDYIGEDHPRDARYHLDIGDAGKQKVRTATPGRMVRVLRIEKPNGQGPFGYNVKDDLMPHPYGDESHDVPYTLMNPLSFDDESNDPDAYKVRQRQPYADKIPARYVRGRVFGFLPQHNVGDYFNARTLRGLHDLGYGVSQYDVPGEHVLLGRTQVAWEPEHATQVSHTAIPEHFDLDNMRRNASWIDAIDPGEDEVMGLNPEDDWVRRSFAGKNFLYRRGRDDGESHFIMEPDQHTNKWVYFNTKGHGRKGFNQADHAMDYGNFLVDDDDYDIGKGRVLPPHQAAWFVYEGNAADPIVDGADPRAIDPNDQQYGIDGVCPVPGRGGDQTYTNQPPIPGQQMPRVAMPLPGDDEFADSIPHGQNNSSRNTKIQDEVGMPVLRKNMYSIKGADNEVFGSLVHRAIGSNAARVVHDVEGDPNVVMVQMEENLDPPGGYVEHSLPWGTGLRKPKSAATPKGIMTGLGDLLTRERDSNFNNWGILPDGTPYRYDFEQTRHSPDRSREITENALGEPIHWSGDVHSDFSHHFTHGPKEDKFQPLSDNPLHPEHDVPRITAALQALRPDYLAHDRKDWHDELMRRWGEVAPHAKGTTSVLKNIVLPHERVLDPRYAAKKAPVYKGFIYLIQRERDIDLGNREIANPDDPDGDMTEQSAWWEIDHAKKNPALRQECKKGTPWDELELWADKSVRENKQVQASVAKLAAIPADNDKDRWDYEFERLTDPIEEERKPNDGHMTFEDAARMRERSQGTEHEDTANKLYDAFKYLDDQQREAEEEAANRPGDVAMMQNHGFNLDTRRGEFAFNKFDPNGWEHTVTPGRMSEWQVRASAPGTFMGLGPNLERPEHGTVLTFPADSLESALDRHEKLLKHSDMMSHGWGLDPNDHTAASSLSYVKTDPDGTFHRAFPGRNGTTWHSTTTTFAGPGDRLGKTVGHEHPGGHLEAIIAHHPGTGMPHEAATKEAVRVDDLEADRRRVRTNPKADPEQKPSRNSPTIWNIGGEPYLEKSVHKDDANNEFLASLVGRSLGADVSKVMLNPRGDTPAKGYARRSILTRVVPGYTDFINMDHYQRQRVRENEMQSVRGKRLGLLDTLVNVGDHNSINHGTKPAPSEPTGKAPHGIDYEQSFEGFHEFNPWKVNSPYTQHFLDQDGYAKPIDNPLTQRDVARGRQALARLKPMFDAVDRGNDHDALMDRWEKLGAHATGVEGEDILPENLPEPSVLARESHPTSLFKHIPETGQVMHAYDTGRGRWVHRTFQGSDDKYPMAIARAHENALANGGDFRDLGYQPGYPRYMMGNPPNLQPRVSNEVEKCMYCKEPATKKIVHSEGMAKISVCDKHLEKGKTDAANCTPDGSHDPSNIDSIRKIKTASGLSYPSGFPESYVDPRPKLPEGLRYHDAPDQPYQSVGNEDFWRFQDPTLIPPLNEAAPRGYQIGQNISHPRSVDVQPMVVSKPDSEYQDEEAFDAANALSSPRGSKTEVKWNDPICENCYLRHGDYIPEWRHNTAMHKYYDDLGEEKHEFNPINPEFVHGKLKEARVAMPLTQHEPVVTGTEGSGEGSLNRKVTLPSGDWLAKTPGMLPTNDYEEDEFEYPDPEDEEYRRHLAANSANMEEFASRLGRAISDPNGEALTPEAVVGNKTSDPGPTVYVRRYPEYRDMQDGWLDHDDLEHHINSQRGQQMGYLHSVLGDSDKLDHNNMLLLGDPMETDSEKIREMPTVSIDHTQSTLPAYAEGMKNGDSFLRYFNANNELSPYADRHFLGRKRSGLATPRKENPLAPGDTERAVAAAETMRPWAKERGIEHWVDAAQDRMRGLGEHASGATSMFPYQMAHEQPMEHVAAEDKGEPWWKIKEPEPEPDWLKEHNPESAIPEHANPERQLPWWATA